MNKLKPMIMISISDVLEKMFFMSLEFTDAPEAEAELMRHTGNLVSCSLDFKGPLSGRFYFYAPLPLLTSMAADFMGEPYEAITEDHRLGIAREVVNMVAGNMFARLDDTSEFNLGIPEIRDPKGVSLTANKKNRTGLIVAESLDGYLAFDLEMGHKTN